jgi:integral membrane protein (TIGR01906 family)
VARLLPVATALVILGLTVLPFLTPAWVGFEQGRTDVTSWTGFTQAEVTTVTNAILGDLVLDRGDFDVARNGTPVLDDAERSHMRDVRGVFAGFGLLVLVAAGFLVYAARRAREQDSRRELWTGVRNGAAGLAVVIAILGGLSLVAFDAMFEAFHELFFPAGTFTFDPATSKLVQLFPDRFWSETTLAVGAVGLVAALAVTLLAVRRLARTSDTAAAPSLTVSGATR